ncbi:MAG: restriction endonuclease subunit S [Rhodocyclaceae bacterium]|nr:restriction endonuclease subunit S [Rhodocyclaceae bacterium]MBK9309741.1 restriction endonuclease subunit S [Rhodocyclaceae bacterium]
MKAGWAIKPLGEICDFQRGLTYAKTDEVEVSNNIVLRANNIDLSTNLLDLSELKYISDSVAVPASKKVKKDSLLICTASGSKSHLGKIAFIDDDYDFAFGGFMGMLTPSADVFPRYLFHLMTSGDYKDFIGALSDGANINNLKFSDLQHFRVPIPPLPEQRRIVAILDAAFDGIATAKANAEQNLQNARALFESHLQKVFTERGGGWVERSLETVVSPGCSLSYGIVQPGDDRPNGLPIVRPTDLTAKLITIDGLKRIDPKLADSYKRTTLQGGDLLLCVRGSTGVISVAAPELAGANVTRGIVPITFEPSILRQDFGYFLMTSEMVQSQIRAKTYGTALMQINIGDLRKIVVAIPPLEMQEVMAAELDRMRSETQRLESLYRQKLAALDALKKSLLHQAFSGQL